MEFWGVEVKAEEPLKVQPDFESLIHISQAALGESKKERSNESVHLFLNIDGKKMVLGTLNGQNIPQLSFDLVFEKEFELSHNWKNGSVYVIGYQTPMPDDGPTGFEDEDYSEDEDEMIPLGSAGNGEVKLGNAKPDASKAKAGKAEVVKPKVKAADPKKDNKSEDESDEDGSDDEDDSDEDSEEGMSVDGESDEDEDDESDSEDEETPKKPEPSKKRPNDSATKTPVSSKKQKTTPQKTDGKKPAPQTATPHPAKKGGKGAAKGNKSQSPKSGGQFSCTSCKKSFGSEAGLNSHNSAKHAAK